MLIKIHKDDNVLVALSNINKNETITEFNITALDDITQGHKVALKDIKTGEMVIKYGFPIGTAKNDILAGNHVHTHNVKTNLSEHVEYKYEPVEPTILNKDLTSKTFEGFLRKDGKAAVRNEIWIIPTVGCVNGIALSIAKKCQDLVSGSLEGIYAFTHPFGCSQMGEDHNTTKKLLASLSKHPNAAGVLVLGLGCENNTLCDFKKEIGEFCDDRIKFLSCQDVQDEFSEGEALIKELAEYAKSFERMPLPISKLVIGMKCGGSDGLSGITANPTVGAFSDMLTSYGGTTILTEVPEMFGAEALLMNRCINKEVFDKTVNMINDFKEYFVSHNQVVYENPSPGNKEGGITTLEDKSLGCVQKGGKSPVCDVLKYAEIVKTNGLNLLSGPGNDLVSTTAMTASGAHIILFTTGRGTPFGAPVPTVKISTNTNLAQKKKNWIDFNAGVAVAGESIETVSEKLMETVISIASGKKTKTEEQGFREISIFKDGVVL